MRKVFAMSLVVVGMLVPGASRGQVHEEDRPPKLCVDRCGDGTCQEIVCMAEGCPCAETPSSCAEDCAPKE